MSYYTTEVRYLCESMTDVPLENFDNLKGVRRIDAIIDSSKGNIFDFEYPIFDEAYRGVLEKKILRHYYTREIGQETFGLFQLFLSDKMNEIMPYYNQLYESELLKHQIEPLTNSGYYQTDNNRKMGQDVDETVGRVTDTYNTIDSDITNREYNKNEGSGGRDRATTVNGSESEIKTNEDSIRTPNLKTESNTYENNIRTPDLKTVTDSDNESVRTPNLSTDTITGNESFRENNSSSTSNSSNSNTRSPNLTESNSGTDTQSTKYNRTTETEQDSDKPATNKSTNWHIMSDTPQGGLNNITGGSGSISGSNVGQPPQSSGSTMYASQIQEDTVYNETNSGKTTEKVKSDSGFNNGAETVATQHGHTVTNTGSETTTGSQSDTSNDIGREETRDNGTSTTKNTGSETTTDNGSSTIKNTGNETTVNSGNGTVKNTGNESNVSNSIENRKSTDNGIATTEYGKTLSQTGNDKETVNRIKGGNVIKDSGNTHTIKYGSMDEYLKHLIGYVGISQSKLLNEFRETFLNIDKMIIEELNILFFGLYN